MAMRRRPTKPAPTPTRARRTVRAIDQNAPVRSCVGCRRRRPSSELVRITRSIVGGSAATLGVGGPSAGRGAWLCRHGDPSVGVVEEACLDRAISQKQFGRAWRTSLGQDDVEAIRAALRPHEQRTG